MMRGAGVGPPPGVSGLVTSERGHVQFFVEMTSFHFCPQDEDDSLHLDNTSFTNALFPSYPSQLRQRMETPAPSEQDVELLMGLGFDRDTVVRVLRSCGNNTEAAANRLLGH